MKTFYTSIVNIGILALSNLNLNAQVSTAFNTGSSGNYVGWNSGQAFPLLVKHEAAQPINFFTNNTQKMTILSGGNVGINTSSPAFKLQVSGGDIDAATSTNGYRIGGNYILWHNGNTTDIFVGTFAGNSTLTGHYNTFMGNNAGNANTSGTTNAFFGNVAGTLNTTGSNNTFLGANCGPKNTTGYENTFIGEECGASNTIGYSNIMLGFKTGYLNVDGIRNTYIGNLAGYTGSNADDNTFVGFNTGYANTTGTLNTFVGTYSGSGNTTGINNTFLGEHSGFGSSTGTDNTFIGQNSGERNQTGSYNTYEGTGSGYYNSTGNYNTISGYQAGYGVAGNNYSYNTLIGYKSGTANTTGGYNTCLGYGSGMANTSASLNTFLGHYTGRVSTTATKCTFVGATSGYSNTTGSDNCALGYRSCYSNTTGLSNSCLGAYSGYFSTTGGYNTFIGHSAGYSNTTAYYNTLVGAYAGNNITTSFYNTAVGYQASFSTSNGYNTALGNIAGYNNGAGDRNTFLGYGADVDANGPYTNSTALGYNSVITQSNMVRFGNGAVTRVEGPVAYTFSDGRFKFNVNEDVKGLDFIKRLRPVSYQFDGQAFDEFHQPNSQQPLVADSSGQQVEQLTSNEQPLDYSASRNIVHTGFIAQEVEQAAIATGFVTDLVHSPTSDRDNYSLAYGAFVVPLVKAVQEQQAIIESILTKNDSLKRRLSNLEEAVKQCCAAPSQNRLEGGQDENGGVSYTSNATEQPNLMQNSPNPFSTNTEITYYLPQGVQNAQLKIYNLLGEVLRVFQLSGLGYGKVNILGGSLSAGNYNYSLEIEGQNYQTKTMILTK